MIHVIIVYDVVSNKHRNRVAKLLERHLNRVQKSVFEGEIPVDRLYKIQERIPLLIQNEKDTVRIYRLCRRCVRMPVLLGVSTWTPLPEEDEVL